MSPKLSKKSKKHSNNVYSGDKYSTVYKGENDFGDTSPVPSRNIGNSFFDDRDAIASRVEEGGFECIGRSFRTTKLSLIGIVVALLREWQRF